MPTHFLALVAARISNDIRMIFFRMKIDKMCSLIKNILHYLMSVAKQMSATGHCYSGLVIVVIVATAIKMTNKGFFK